MADVPRTDELVEPDEKVLKPPKSRDYVNEAESKEQGISLHNVHFLTVGAARELVRAKENGIKIYNCTKEVEKALKIVRVRDDERSEHYMYDEPYQALMRMKDKRDEGYRLIELETFENSKGETLLFAAMRREGVQ